MGRLDRCHVKISCSDYYHIHTKHRNEQVLKSYVTITSVSSTIACSGINMPKININTKKININMYASCEKGRDGAIC